MHIAYARGRDVVVQVVTVVTVLIRNDFFRHHLASEVVTRPQVVTGKNGKGHPRGHPLSS
jgi:hypothetical protein